MIPKRNILIASALLFGVLLYLRPHTFLPDHAVVTNTPVLHKSLPIRLTIASIHVDAPIESVGTDADGAMQAPATPEGAAWFDLGPLPGEKGSAVIAGHSGWKDGIPALFDRLKDVHKGDLITVENSQGVVSTFIVRDTHIYDAGVDASSIFTSSSGPHLNLITCIGTWNVSQKSYSERLVVFTDLVL
jgi:LPXTG-site transpeptidase (sortase) family protein